MMVYSMTAYANQEIPLKDGVVRWELRSLNHRHLDLSFKLPEWMQDQESALRGIVREHLQRGKVDCVLRVEISLDKQHAISLDEKAIEQLRFANQRVQESFPEATTLSVAEILRWPSVVENINQYTVEFKEEICSSFSGVIKRLLEVRQAEGEKIKNCLMERLTKMQKIVTAIKVSLPEIEERFKIKLAERLDELKAEIHQERFNQEVVYCLQKMNIAEEIDRLVMHLQEAKRVLEQERSVGRRLDFLMQELNREVNTIAAKTTDNEVAQSGIDMKILIEEMREQTHNVE